MMLSDICKQCNMCGFNVNEVIDDEHYIIYLVSNREISRFFNISITTSNCIAQYEISHRDFLSLLLKSKFKFNQAVFYILDVKFSVWRDSIITLSNIIRTLFVSYTQTEKKCAQFKKIIEQEVLEKYRALYNSQLQKIRNFYIEKYKLIQGDDKKDIDNNFKLNFKIIDSFIKTHERLYNVFKQDILSLDQPEINGQYDMYIRKYSNTLIKAMELTVVEAASLNRLYVDGAVYVTSEVINSILNKKINIIENMINITGIKPKTIIYAEDGLDRYEHLFVNYINK
jgi:hypothetical protein